MPFTGMDVDQVRGHAERVTTDRGRLQELLARLDGEVQRSAGFWVGPDGDGFRFAWTDGALRGGADLLSLLSRAAADLSRHADEQDQASEGTTVGSPGGAGGAVRGAADVRSPFDDPRSRGEVAPDVAEAWSDMGPGDREDVTRAMIEAELERYGLEDASIVFTDEITGNGRATNEDPLLIEIHEDRLADPGLLHTLAHEVRHGAQFQAIEDTEPGFWDFLPWNDSTAEDYERLEEDHGFTREEIDDWRENFEQGNYENPPQEEQNLTPEQEDAQWDRYLDQPVEVDAREGGREFVEGMTMDELHAYQDAAGVERSPMDDEEG